MAEIEHYGMTFIDETVHEFAACYLDASVGLPVAHMEELGGLDDVVGKL